MTPCGGGGPITRICINTCLHLANTEHYSALHPHPQRFARLPSRLHTRRRSGKSLGAPPTTSTSASPSLLHPTCPIPPRNPISPGLSPRTRIRLIPLTLPTNALLLPTRRTSTYRTAQDATFTLPGPLEHAWLPNL